MAAEIKAQINGEAATVHISGNVDERGAEALKGQFTALPVAKLKEVVVDMGAVQNIGSSGIGKLLLFYKTLAVGGSSLRVINLPPHLHELFLELKFDTLFTISAK
ncbi:MAG: STAS domain-containing protein [Thermodesulfobacteriota bacterium]